MSEENSIHILDLSTQFEPFKNIAMFSDIHFGNHHNSIQHNEDCLEFIHWFIDQCKDRKVDAIFMLGDWFEHRGAINTLTSKYSLRALRLLNSLNIPIMFLVGNHDLYHRHNREVHSAEGFRELKNVHIIDHPSKINDLLLVPFLFKDEYPLVAPYVNKAKYVFGHFEFRNFYITGTNTKAEHGYHHKLFDGPKQIFSGHYHKRQANDNVCYIGNPFGTSYADAGDYDRGCCILNTESQDIDFVDYNGPTYLKTILSQLINGEIVPNQKARIRCLLDIDVSYSEAQSLKSELMELYELRELILEENIKEQQMALEESIAELDELDLSALDETVTKLIETGVQGTTTINPSRLAQIYKKL
jgi:DNA repair exonuclease SbcCD nuclease subunit